MSDTTQNLALPLVAAAQAQKHVTINEAFAALDGIVQLSVIDADLAAAPASPAEGDRYIVAAAATGVWAGQEGRVASYEAGAWEFRIPKAGWRAWVADEGREFVHDGSGWFAAIALSPKAATISLQVIEEAVIASGASVDTTITIPDRAIVFAVSSRTTQTITGATSYDCGVAADTGKFGSLLGITAGNSNSGVIGPVAYFTPTAIRLTANGGNFTGGQVRIAIHFMLCGVPTA